MPYTNIDAIAWEFNYDGINVGYLLGRIYQEDLAEKDYIENPMDLFNFENETRFNLDLLENAIQDLSPEEESDPDEYLESQGYWSKNDKRSCIQRKRF